MNVTKLVLWIPLVLVGCASLNTTKAVPANLAETGHVVASVPRAAQLSSFLGALQVDYAPSAAVTMDPWKSPAVKVVTESLTVAYDKRDASRVNLVGQTDNYLATWKGTANGAPCTLTLAFRSPNYVQTAMKGTGTVSQILEVTVGGPGVEGCDFSATGADIVVPSVLLTFRPSLDKVTLTETPGVIALGGAQVRVSAAGTVTWPLQAFVLGLPDGREIWLKNDRIYSDHPLAPGEQTEIALVEVLRTVVRAITG
jgi:hypothetical protein